MTSKINSRTTRWFSLILFDEQSNMGWIINRDMKILVLLTLISSNFFPVFAEGHKKYKDEDFDKN